MAFHTWILFFTLRQAFADSYSSACEARDHEAFPPLPPLSLTLSLSKSTKALICIEDCEQP